MLTGYRERLQLISYLHLHSDLSFDIDQLDALWALFEDTTAEVPLPVLKTRQAHLLSARCNAGAGPILLLAQNATEQPEINLDLWD